MKTYSIYSKNEPNGVVIVGLLLLLTPLIGAIATLTAMAICLAFFLLMAWKRLATGIAWTLALALVLATLILLCLQSPILIYILPAMINGMSLAIVILIVLSLR